MRLLLSVTLTYFFFLFPYKSNSTPVLQTVQATTCIHSLSETGDEDYSEYGIHTTTIFHCHNIRKSSNQNSSVHDIQMSSSPQVFVLGEILPGAGSVGKTCFHCTPIALKLIFPKHYFW